MKGILLSAVCLALGFASFASAQNEIDYVNSLHWSGYGKMAIDGDTLYLNSLNGQGVERYDISNPANPTFIDREDVSGFDQIDFERRLMAKLDAVGVQLIDFSSFDSVRILSTLPLVLPWTQNLEWKLLGNFLIAVSSDDSIRTYNISNPLEPYLSSIYGTIYRVGSYGHNAVLGSTVCVLFDRNMMGYIDYRDVYNIANPDSIYLVDSDTLYRAPTGGHGIADVRGDTIALTYVGSAGYSWSIQFVSFAPNDTSRLPSWGESANGRPPGYYSSDNAFIFSVFNRGVVAYSINNFVTLGKAPDPFTYGGDLYTFDCSSDYHFTTATSNSLRIFQPTYSDSLLMPLLASTGPAHYGIRSVAAYGDYVLSGVESNGGELLVHHLGPSGDLDYIASLDSIDATCIIISGSSAICLLPNKIVEVKLSNPSNPYIGHEIGTFADTLVDFTIQDSILYIISTQGYYLIDYDSLTGFNQISSLPIPGSQLTSICQYETASFILKGDIGTIIKVETADPTNPAIADERRLPQNNYQNLEQFHISLWASGSGGTDVISANRYMQYITSFGPEYFPDVYQMYVSHDTLYVADGINGLKVYTFNTHPYYGLYFIGGYGTGNVVNQVARIGDNFFASDYYSLQHLRWGAPTGVGEGDETPLPEMVLLSQNYPNPFNAQTTIQYELPSESKVSITIYNILGERLERMDLGRQPAGRHTALWDATGLSSGIYFYQIEAGQLRTIKKMILLK